MPQQTRPGIVELTLESLADLDNGRVSVAFAHELKQAVLDCIDRPGDKSVRVVSMEFKLTPIIEPEGQCDRVHGEFKIKGNDLLGSPRQ